MRLYETNESEAENDRIFGSRKRTEKVHLIGPRRLARSAILGLVLHVKTSSQTQSYSRFSKGGYKSHQARLTAPQPAHLGVAIKRLANTIFSDAIIPVLKHRIPLELRILACLGESSIRIGDPMESPHIASLLFTGGPSESDRTIFSTV